MLSSDRNIETISQLFSEIKHYLELRGECLQIDIVHKLCKLLSALVLGSILFVIGGLALLFITLFLAAFLAPHVGGESVSYVIIVALYLLLAFIIYQKRHSWIEAPITRLIAQIILSGMPEPNRPTDHLSDKNNKY